MPWSAGQSLLVQLGGKKMSFVFVRPLTITCEVQLSKNNRIWRFATLIRRSI